MAVRTHEDFPLLHSRPSADTLLAVLERLRLAPRIFGRPGQGKHADEPEDQKSAAEIAWQRRELNSFLSAVTGSALTWIDDPDVQDAIWTLASKRISERCGRSAMGDVTRTWPFSFDPAPSATLDLTIREPALTGDGLGHKTWCSSRLLALHLPRLASTSLLHLFDESPGDPARPRVLELGSGTGLLGLAAAAAWRTCVTLTDLAAIVPNLVFNAEQNRAVVERRGGFAEVGVLEWGDSGEADEHVMTATTRGGHGPEDGGGYEIVIAADVLYDDDSPGLLVHTIRRHLRAGPDARMVLLAPQRDAYAGRLLAKFVKLMAAAGERALVCIEEESLVGEDDWEAAGFGEPETAATVNCWMGIFARKTRGETCDE